jgi:hypothetical protein
MTSPMYFPAKALPRTPHAVGLLVAYCLVFGSRAGRSMARKLKTLVLSPKSPRRKRTRRTRGRPVHEWTGYYNLLEWQRPTTLQ